MTLDTWQGDPATECVWCLTPFGPETDRLRGRAICPICATGTTDPVPTPEALDAAYGDWYWPGKGARFSLIGDALLRRSRASMASRVDQVAPAGKILDVGAGEGTLIDALAARGREVSGLERDSDHPSIENLEIDQMEGDGEFAAVIFWHSLEHMGRPQSMVENAARLLKPGGVIFIAVPNLGSMQSAAFGDRWLHLDLPRHLVHFTAGSLEKGLVREGFQIRAKSRTRAGQLVIGWLDGLVGKLPGHLNLYQSLRRKSARRIKITPGRRAAAIAAGVILFPVAVVATLIEVASGKPGTVYVEAEHV